MKKLLLVLAIMLILAIAISISPLAEYIYSLYAAEMPADSTAITAAPDTEANKTPTAPSKYAVGFALGLSFLSVIMAAVIFVKKREAGS